MSNTAAQLPVTKEFQINDPVRWRTNVPMLDSCNITTSQWYVGRVTRSTGNSTDVEITEDKGNRSSVSAGYNCFENGMSEVESLIDPATMAARKREHINGLIDQENVRHENSITELTNMLLSIEEPV